MVINIPSHVDGFLIEQSIDLLAAPLLLGEKKMTSIPPHLRICAAKFPQPLNPVDMNTAQQLVNCIAFYNSRTDIKYRSSSGEEDILRHVFRWDLTPYEEVFQNGFKTTRRQDIPDAVYCNLENYIQNGPRPIDSRRPARHIFISTTIKSDWHPTPIETVNEIYRYEIYAPGGIWVSQTLGHRYSVLHEVCFVSGIAPQYIRAAQRFRLLPDRRTVIPDNEISVNGYFDPHPSRFLNIRRPIFDYLINENGTREPLNISIWRPYVNWYARDVANYESYINAAFRSSHANEAYIFMTNEYVLLDYANDRVVNGPLPIRDGFPSLTDIAFAEHGIDCAFGSHSRDEAFIFSGNLCAQIVYAPHRIINGPMTITAMFPLLKQTVFESAIDAAFESLKTYEAYLFKDKYYALINYDAGQPGQSIRVQLITQGFPYLRETIFENGIDAAFASSTAGEAYLFKGDSFARINFAAGFINIIGRVRDNWRSLGDIFPRTNRGLDGQSHSH